MDVSKGVFIIGTDTDVGKTFVSAGLVYALKDSGIDVGYYKPALSGAIEKNGRLIPGDVDFVKEVAMLEDTYEDMNTYLFKDPVSPHLASRNEGIKMDVDAIIRDYGKQTKKHEFVVVEGAGGLIVPFIEYDYFLYDLIKELDLSVIIVTRASLGTINHTALTANNCLNLGIDIRGIIVNGYEKTDAIDENIRAIEAITKQEILAVIPKLDMEHNDYNEMKNTFKDRIIIDKLTD